MNIYFAHFAIDLNQRAIFPDWFLCLDRAMERGAQVGDETGLRELKDIERSGTRRMREVRIGAAAKLKETTTR